MFYFGLSGGADRKARDLVAVGPDRLHLTKPDEVLIDAGTPGSIADDYAHKPALIYDKGALYHFHCVVGGHYPNDARGIPMARSRPW